jgi:hypothetical protein
LSRCREWAAAAWLAAGSGLALTAATAQAAGVREVVVADPAPWALPPPAPSATPPSAQAALTVIYNDTQYMAGAEGLQVYSAVRYRITKPEGLAAGNLTLTWSPDAGSMVLHRLRVIHGGTTRDLTRSAKFAVMQREQNLELAALDGRLTAAYQIPGWKWVTRWNWPPRSPARTRRSPTRAATSTCCPRPVPPAPIGCALPGRRTTRCAGRRRRT